jgi:2-haloacid dehalogenase
VTASGDYEPFPDIAAKALMGAAREAGFPLERSRADWIVEGLTSLPAFDDVGPGLDRLAELGVPLAILTNGTVDGITAVVENSGLNGRFAHLLSVDTVRRFKPARETYGLVEPAFGRPLGEILFVTAHEWDVAGAKAAGMQTAFLARGERCAPVLGREPDIEAPDLPELAYILAR